MYPALRESQGVSRAHAAGDTVSLKSPFSGLVPLASVKPGGLAGGVLAFLCPAEQAVPAVTALEDFKAMRTFPPVLSADLPFGQHGLADLRPKVSGAAQPFGAV